jgi:peptidoglycan/xylan/chitin deacetylase (PgdA/CDA1 family)
MENLALRVARKCGLFAAARALSSSKLRILCYHGVALGDEDSFQPMLFMKAETFAARLDHLARSRYTVLPLAEALERLRSGTLTGCAVVITIDDGWYGTFSCMKPALATHGFPATLYLSTYYVEKQTQVFNVAAAYALWRSRAESIDLGVVDPRLQGRLQLSSRDDRALAARKLCELADSLASASERQQLLERLFRVLGIDFEVIRMRRMFAFMTSEEAATLPQAGTELQLHTHRHRFPSASPEDLQDEITTNRKALARISTGPFRHLCYPSGEYDRSAFGQLEALEIESATTTRPGMNTAQTPRMELKRFLDSEAYSQIRFEAEVSGFLELLRGLVRPRQHGR